MAKIKHKWVEGPEQIKMRSQNGAVKNNVLSTIKKSAWFAYSKNVIQRILCSSHIKQRKKRIKKNSDDSKKKLGDNSVS